MRLPVLLAVTLTASACAQPSHRTTGAAQASRVLTDDEWCADGWQSREYETACEVREIVTSADALDVAATNGSVTVKRWDRSDVLVRARVTATARQATEAARLVDATEVTVRGGVVREETPDTARDRWVAVSYEVFAPGRTDLEATATNGPVNVHGLDGVVTVLATNGPVQLTGVSGDVGVWATNGPVGVTLDGRTWRGAGLDVTATNGPITVELPRDYSARLSAETRVGRISTDGLDLPRRERASYVGDALDETLGSGGAPVRLRATNGPVRLKVLD